MTEERVLVVDDEKDFREFMISHLSRRGYEVESAANGIEAMKVLQANGPFAVLVTDLTMPEMGGLELLRYARGHDPEIEVVVISANDTIETAIAALRENGAYDYLLKPLANNNELSMAVGRAADYRRLRQERESLQNQLLAEAKRLQALIATTGDAIIAADAQGVVTVINPAAAQLLGRDNLVGASALPNLPRSLATLVSNWQTVGGQQPAVVEVPWAGNSVRLVNLTPLPGSDGKTEGWVMVLSDITHLKRLDELQMRLLTEAANKIQLPLVQALAGVVELNQMNEGKSERFNKTLFSLAKVLSQIQKWIDDLLIMARVEAGIGIQPVSLNVADLVQEWAQTANKTLLQDKALRLNIIIGENVPMVYADRELVFRLLQQLLDQMASRARAEPGRALRISVNHHQGQVWIDVTTEGVMPKTTDPVRRVTKTLGGPATTTPAAWPDLAVVSAIVNGVGGQVWVRGKEPVGTAIAICLPAIAK
ncbi:MAG: response regulator [Chloroflexi bacterium]|nr:response regulator [Chloroflexota bacterium]